VARADITGEDAALAVDLVYGSMWYRLIFRAGPLDCRWAGQVAGAVAKLAPADRAQRPR